MIGRGHSARGILGRRRRHLEEATLLGRTPRRQFAGVRHLAGGHSALGISKRKHSAGGGTCKGEPGRDIWCNGMVYSDRDT